MRRLIVCCDGTWNDANDERRDTNVLRMARAIRANRDGLNQVLLYLRGVGTSGLTSDHLLGGATGLGLDENIRSAYMFLAQNYVPGDEIFLFGFSRGAFTARSVAGLMRAVGLLKRQSLGKLGAAWNYYRSKGSRTPEAFAVLAGAESHIDVTIKFLGVWDTVGAMGLPVNLFSNVNRERYGFHDTTPSAIVQNGFHALAIDEHRDEFVPTLWTGQPAAGCQIEQVWFAGAHSDVGGGYMTRDLADIPLCWMACRAAEQGLVIDWTCLPKAETSQALAPMHDSRTTLYLVDKAFPLLRRLCSQSFDLPIFQRLYAPMDEAGHELPVINEKVHQSVLDRFGRRARVCTSDEDGRCEEGDYIPRNVAALLSTTGEILPGVKVASWDLQQPVS